MSRKGYRVSGDVRVFALSVNTSYSLSVAANNAASVGGSEGTYYSNPGPCHTHSTLPPPAYQTSFVSFLLMVLKTF